MEEWQRLGLDVRQFAYGKWWTAPREGDPQLIEPQPAPPSRDADGDDWV